MKTDKIEKSESFLQAMAVGTKVFDRPGLSAPPMPAHEVRELESTVSLDIPISVREKLDCREKFDRRLVELREQYAPFLRELAPDLPRRRHKSHLETFEFRFEEEADLKDAHRPYTQQGEWETVDIPHYRGPHGRWAAYYRTRFVPGDEMFSQGRAWLVFRGVDYKAQVFLNGHYIGSHEGFFAEFSFDVTARLRPNEENTLLVRVENDAIHMGNHSWSSKRGWSKEEWPSADYDGDKVYGGTGLGWNAPEGWSHCPPGGGIWQPVYLESRPPVFINDIFVRPDIDKREVEVWVEVYNSIVGNIPVRAELAIYPQNFEGRPIEGVKAELKDAGPRISEYRLRIPFEDFRLWQPDEPFLYALHVRLTDSENGADDCCSSTFGMRKFHQDVESSPKGTLFLNNEPVIMRGSNTMGHMQRSVYENNLEQVVDDVLIAKMANLNFFRLTQRPVQREIYEKCDALGMMLQTDLPAFAGLRKSCIEETGRQAGEMERLVRSHPSVVLVSFLNEPMAGHYDVKSHRLVDRETLENFFEVASHLVHLYNPDRVVKCIDGDYDPPVRHGMPDEHCYSTTHDNHGIAFGKLHAGHLFAYKEDWKCGVGEYGAEGFDTWDVMRKYYPAHWLPDTLDSAWTPDVIPTLQAWGWHYQWYDKQETLRQWMQSSWQQQAWGVRLATEALRRRADVVISTTLHLLINAWPNGWQKSLVTVDRTPLPAFFAFADALTPLAVNAVTNRHAVYAGEPLEMDLWLLNDTNDTPDGMTIEYWVREMPATELLNQADDRLLHDSQEEARHRSKPLFIQQIRAVADPLAASYQGAVSWKTPDTGKRIQLEFGTTLKDAGGDVLHDHAVRVEVFPLPNRSLLAGRSVCVLGGGLAGSVATHFGAGNVSGILTGQCELLIADSPQVVAENSDALQAFYAAGGVSLFLNAPEDTVWELPNGNVRVLEKAEGGGKNHFVSRKTGHPAVDSFSPFDFFMWFNGEKGHIDHISKGYLEAEELKPILLTGSGCWYTERRELSAAAELQCGKGLAVFDQTCAATLMTGEPRAEMYLGELLEYLLERK